MLSYYESILSELDKVMIKFEDKNSKTDPDITKSMYKTFYIRHFFMIKILKHFFEKIYEKWDDEYKLDMVNFKPQNKIVIENYTEGIPYFFLFNIFRKIIDTYAAHNLPPVANYIRINDISGNLMVNTTFAKSNKHNLDKSALEQCPGGDTFVDVVKDIHFNEIFDQGGFKENATLSQYQGLSNFLSEGKSIMQLTYGYSGVGKTFTLFGNSENQGMLQNTISNLSNCKEYKVKLFELYGLGVPYKFYWENPNLFAHKIYEYKIYDGVTTVTVANEYGNNQIENYVKLDNGYNTITRDQITKFGDIVTNIDNIRRENGRIKATINNPESSRSIMIYDFNFTFDDASGTTSNFVVMDLPGKENLFETYCKNATAQQTAPVSDTSSNLSSSSVLQKYMPIKDYYAWRKKPLKSETMPQYSDQSTYDLKLITSMMYINPMWLGVVPEIAEVFDPISNHFVVTDVSNNIITYKMEGSSLTKYTTSNSQLSRPKKPTASDYNAIQNGLYGMLERGFYTIVDLIKTGNLWELGKKIDSLVSSNSVGYGYAGLEGHYINENILGLLQVLAQKIQKDRSPKVNIVCQQKEIYKTLLANKDDNRIMGFSDDVQKIKQGDTINTNEFYSQIKLARQIFGQYENVKQATSLDNYKGVAIRNKQLFTEMKNTTNTCTSIPPANCGDKVYLDGEQIFDNLGDIDKNIITNYDYNKIFNISNPPIKAILDPYLNNDKFKNFYLFFVVSNNQKKGGIEICTHQLKLLSDTKDFMAIIAEPQKALGIICPI
jgi:hypothetical protein